MKRVTAAALTAGALASAGLAATVLRERQVRRRRRFLAGDQPFGSVHSERHTVTAIDGTAINVEIDEADEGNDDVTVVFVHGWLCDMDTWHFQRLALRGTARLVFVDQRGHGHSGPVTSSSATFNQLGDDLARVIEEHGRGTVVVVGHSMGGMAAMQLAADHPQLFGAPIAAVALVGTSAGKLMRGKPALERLGWLVRRSSPLLDWGRALNSAAVMERWAVGPGTDPARTAMVDEMISRSSTRLILDFYPNFPSLDLFDALDTMSDITVTVVCGTADLRTPAKHSRRLVEAIDGARLVLVEGAGHMVMMEKDLEVTEAVADLIEKVRG